LEHQTDRYLGARAVAGPRLDGSLGHRALPARLVVCQILVMTLLVCLTGTGHAQVMGEEAELDRLRTKAEEAMGNDDAEGAAMSMGRAALMAGQLAKRQADPTRQRTFKASEHLYRSQEHGYRAVALFRRAGGELPASAGVCGSLQLAELELRHAQTTLDQSNQAENTDSLSPRLKALQQTTDDWTIVLGSMQAEFHCPS